jgi:DNA-directed RNA polymerase specialized sigma24 family protein
VEQVFRDHMSELYSLAYLLTGDKERSVEAYTGALNAEVHPPALQRFMLSWARKLVIVEAVGTIRRQLSESMSRARVAFGSATRDELAGLARLASADLSGLKRSEVEEVLLGMDVFQRCAVILTLFEGLPIKEVADLLGADVGTVKNAQARGAVELTWRIAKTARTESRVLPRFGHGVFMALGRACG